jgi:phosphoribosylpyrophosphate synthetase
LFEKENLKEDVAGKTALIVDDVIDTAGTFLKLRKRLNNAGRRR